MKTLSLILLKNGNHQLIINNNSFDDIYTWRQIPNNFVLDQLISGIDLYTLSGKVLWKDEDFEKQSNTTMTIFNKTTKEIIDLVNKVFNTLI